MGLDSVELVLAVEDAFQIAIPDEAAELLKTPRQVVEYIISRLGASEDVICLEQRAFYRLRQATIRVFETPRAKLSPDTKWRDVMPGRDLRHNWRLLHQATGTAEWPRLTLLGKVPASVQSLGATARFLAAVAPASLKGSAAWSQQQVEAVVARLIKEQLNIEEFGWDQEFIRDLGVD